MSFSVCLINEKGLFHVPRVVSWSLHWLLCQEFLLLSYTSFFFFCQIVHKIKTQPLLRCIFFFNCVLLPLSVFMAILWCIYLPLLASWFHVSHLLSFRKLHLVYMVNNILLLKTWSSLGSKLWKKKLFVWLYRILWHT